MSNCYEAFKEHAVPAESVADFLERYTKPKQHRGRGEDYVQARIEAHTEHVKRFGYTIITHHDSVTGDIVAYYPAN